MFDSLKNDSTTAKQLNMIRQFARKRHRGQKWAGMDYSVHLGLGAASVECWAQSFGFSVVDINRLVAAAWLHDVVEDTDTSVEEVRELAGDGVAKLVWAVTDEPGVSRKERKEKTLPKIRTCPLAVLIKLCDREVNVTKARSNNDGRYFSMYQNEHADFVAALRRSGEYDALWDRLDQILCCQ